MVESTCSRISSDAISISILIIIIITIEAEFVEDRQKNG